MRLSDRFLGNQGVEILSSHRIKLLILKKMMGVLFLMIGIYVGVHFGICLKIVVSGSMEPSLPVGSICLISRTYPVEKIQEGDIIAFSMDEEVWITHRVAKKLKDHCFLTKGDANETVDIGRVSKKEYRGKTLTYIPYVGYVCLFCFEKKKIIAVMSFIFIFGKKIGERRKNCE